MIGGIIMTQEEYESLKEYSDVERPLCKTAVWSDRSM